MFNVHRQLMLIACCLLPWHDALFATRSPVQEIRTMSNPSCLRLLRVKVQPSAVRPSTPVLSSRQKPSTPGTCIPSFGEDKEAAFTSFHKAFSDSLPEATRIPGLQAFAGAVRLSVPTVCLPSNFGLLYVHHGLCTMVRTTSRSSYLNQ